MPSRPAPKRRATAVVRATQDPTERTPTSQRSPQTQPRRRVPRSPASALPTSVVLAAAALVVAGTGAIALSVSSAADASVSPYPTLSADLSASIVDQTPGGGAATRSKGLGGSQPVSRTSERDLDQISQDNLAEQAAVQAEQRSAALAQLAKETQKQAEQIDSMQWVLPVAGYTLTARFGDTSGLWATYHTGLDFAAPSGTPLVAVAEGTITSVGYAGAYGNRTIVTLADGAQIWYCHQTSFAVRQGQTVRPGQLIGYVGSTGNVTGPHLHLEVRPGGGDPVDPYGALVAHGVRP